ncbi:MAG: CPBP family intramembrane metalloprotease [Saprospiraceae bacterium]|nr:CPBP family intramembrane metalloprotease [Saprospiraceae bacterium]
MPKVIPWDEFDSKCSFFMLSFARNAATFWYAGIPNKNSTLNIILLSNLGLSLIKNKWLFYTVYENMKQVQHFESPLRNSLQQKPAFFLLVLLFLLLVLSLLSALWIHFLEAATGYDYQATLKQLSNNNNATIRHFIRLANMISQIHTFLLPTLAMAVLAYAWQWWRSLQLHQSPNLTNVVLAIFFMMAVFPLAQAVYFLNKMLPLPESALALEQKLAQLSKALMVMESPYELLGNLATIALIPAIGEELFFRGLLQQKIAQWMQRPQWAIWIAALIFSAFHGQFQGFLPRLLLGASLGYLFFWTKNLWIPIIAHFFNNAAQIILLYRHPLQFSNVEMNSNPPNLALLVVVSSIFVALLSYLIIHFNRSTLDNSRNT